MKQVLIADLKGFQCRIVKHAVQKKKPIDNNRKYPQISMFRVTEGFTDVPLVVLGCSVRFVGQ